MPKTKDKLWDYVKPPRDDGRIQCKYHFDGTGIFSNQIRSVRNHLRTCTKIPDADKKDIADILKQWDDKQKQKSTPKASVLQKRKIFESRDDVITDHNTPSKKKLKQSDFRDYTSNYYYTLSATQQQQAIRLLLNFIVRSAKPLSMVEDESFIRFISFLNPSFSIPSRSDLTNKLLPEFYDLIKAEIELILEELGSVTMGLDGSSDGNGNPIEHIMAMRGEHHFLLDEVQMYGTTKDAEEMKSKLVAMKKYLEQHKCTVNGLNRDNESKMRKCGDLFLEEEKVNDIGCAPHAIHLIYKDYFNKNDKCKDTKSKSSKVLTHLKKSMSKQYLKEQAGSVKYVQHSYNDSIGFGGVPTATSLTLVI